MDFKQKCEKCNDTGIVKDKDGSVHTCFDCLNNNKEMFEQHGNPKDSGIRW
ncbi:hypothetical protein GOV12_06940 [Candidatus Pacearchaeota archaeon]|nr:hypothetical protein [Candidatus Pacearchaeota archaeon]